MIKWGVGSAHPQEYSPAPDREVAKQNLQQHSYSAAQNLNSAAFVIQKVL
jgi:hypothetical protein